MSEFGKGFTYCIGLFLMHTERINEYTKSFPNMPVRNSAYSLWFNGAADHLYELQIPKGFRHKSRCIKWRDKCLHWRLHTCDENDYNWAIEEAKFLLRAWDKQCKIKVEKGTWE